MKTEDIIAAAKLLKDRDRILDIRRDLLSFGANEIKSWPTYEGFSSFSQINLTIAFPRSLLIDALDKEASRLYAMLASLGVDEFLPPISDA